MGAGFIYMTDKNFLSATLSQGRNKCRILPYQAERLALGFSI